MSRIGRSAFVGLGLALLAGSACDHVQGPSLSAVIESQSLAPSATTANAASICCCRVKGTARNTSSIPVNISLRFRGKNAQGGDVGVGVAYLQNVPAGGRADYDAAGIFEACAKVAKVEASLEVQGLFTP